MNNHTKTISSTLLLIVFIALTSCSKSNEINISSLLKEMTDRDAVTNFPQMDFRLKQSSSYNRASLSPQDSLGWFNNKDFNSNDKDRNFIRIEENNGKKEWVLMDHEGPGAIVRTWMPLKNAKKPGTDIIIKFYLDGDTVPALEGIPLDILCK